MKTFAEIKDGVVVNVSVWGEESPEGDQFVEITGLTDVGIGWLYADGQFVGPVQVESTLEVPTDAPT
jgi:hypothetical protein